MKKHFLIALTLLATITVSGQGRGIRIGYIDMEYILEKVPDYAEAKNQLEQKGQKWKQEIEAKKNEITKLKDNLKAERVLLTKELIEEREEEITYLDNELISYQEKRFGPKGDLISQKSVLVKPIQDQVFTAVQEIAEGKYDFVFDKSSDLTMLFAAQRHDISDQVVRRLTRSSKRQQLSGKELKKLEAQEAEEDKMDDPDYADRAKKSTDKKEAREQALEARRLAAEEKRNAALARREQQKQDRENKRNGVATPARTGTTDAPADDTNPDSGATSKSSRNNPATTATSSTRTNQNNSNVNTDDDPNDEAPSGVNNTNRPAATTVTPQTNAQDPIQGENTNQVKTTATTVPEEGTTQAVDRQNAAQATQDERAKKLEERKKAIEERKAKILADREAAKKAREEQKAKPKEEENKNEN